MSNSLDPDQPRRLVVSDLGPNCLPSLSTAFLSGSTVFANSAILVFGALRVKHYFLMMRLMVLNFKKMIFAVIQVNDIIDMAQIILLTCMCSNG